MADARGHVPIAPRPELTFEQRIAALEEAFSGRLGYHALRLGDGVELGLRADDAFPTASVIKIGVACALLELVARGRADLGEQIALPPRAERTPGGGILKQLDVDRLSLRDLLELMIVLSDNAATNAILARGGGPDAVNLYLARIGLRDTSVEGPIDFARITHELGGGIGVSTPRDQTTLLALLARDRILTSDLCALLRDVLARQHLTDQLPRWLGWNTYAQYHGRGWPIRVASKSGELDGIRADAGLVEAGGRTIALAAFTDEGRDHRETVDCEGSLAVAECSAALCAALLGLDC